MQISLNDKITINTSGEGMSDIELVAGALVATGYSQDTVLRLMTQYVEEHERMKRRTSPLNARQTHVNTEYGEICPDCEIFGSCRNMEHK